MLADYPDDFRYVLGLQEAVAVGMADGFAQASGNMASREPPHGAGGGERHGRDLQCPGEPRPAPGNRRSAGAVAHDPAGQPDEPRRDAAAPPAGEVELRAAARRRRARTRSHAAIHLLLLAAAGAGVRVDPDGRLGRGGRGRGDATPGRPVGGRAGRRRPRGGARPRRAACRCEQAGARRRAPTSTPPARGTRRSRWPRAAARRVGHAGAGRRADRVPRGAPRLPGPPAAGRRPGRARRSRPTTWSSPSGPRSSRTTRTSRARRSQEGTELVAITSDPDEAARAPMGDAIVADVALTLAALNAELSDSEREAAPQRPDPEQPEVTDPLDPGVGLLGPGQRLPRGRHRGDRGALLDARAAKPDAAVRARLVLLRCAAAASASGSRPRSACSSRSRTARSSACSARAPPSTRSRGCGPPPPIGCPSSSWSCATTSTRSSSGSPGIESVEGAPGLDLPALECAALADAYGVPSRRVAGLEELETALEAAIASDDPALVEVRVRPGMALA